MQGFDQGDAAKNASSLVTFTQYFLKKERRENGGFVWGSTQIWIGASGKCVGLKIIPE